jgi:DNA-binding SARP family transcriptional activator
MTTIEKTTIENSPLFRLLGPVGACQHDRPVDLGPPREQRLIVALLLSKGRPVPRTSLLSWIWERPGACAMEMLAELMRNVRRRLAAMGIGDALICAKGLCRLDVPAEVVDVHRFERVVEAARRAVDDRAAAELYRQALDLVRGEPLGALRGERIDNCRTTLLDRLAAVRTGWLEVELRLGNHDRYLPDIAELNRAEPLNEKIAGLLMRAYVHSGDQGRALEVFRQIKKRIRDELGNDVGRELAALHWRILDNDPELGPRCRSTRTTTTSP